MENIRVIPVLLLRDAGLVKTIRFTDSVYIGDPLNIMKIFNEKEVDEIVLLDIMATRQKHKPSIGRISEIASECFMPFAYGGGISELREIKGILQSGAEKVVINSAAFFNPELIKEASRQFGSQSIVVSVDAKKNMFNKYEVFVEGGTRNTKIDPVKFAAEMEKLGAGEILLNSIDRDGTYKGYDISLIKQVTQAVGIPVIACGGARNVDDFKQAVNVAGASAVSAGSIFVFQGPHRAVLVSFPDRQALKERLYA
jgi:cyclase